MNTLFEMLPVIYKYKKLHEKRCCEILKKYDLRIADLDILFYFAHSGTKNLSKDVVDIGMSKANVSKSVDHLRQKKLVFLKEDQEDRRCVHIEVAEAAWPIVQEIGVIREEMGKKLFQGVSQIDMESMERVMKQISRNMNSELVKENHSTEERHFMKEGG